VFRIVKIQPQTQEPLSAVFSHSAFLIRVVARTLTFSYKITGHHSYNSFMSLIVSSCD
jgi:hypothetical protein